MIKIPNFLDRNPRLLKEAKILLDRDKVQVGKSDRENGARFYALGSFQSDYLGREVYGGIKDNSKTYFTRSISNLLLINELFPEFEQMIPLFFGVVQENGKYKIIMEDYSCNNTKRVTPLSYSLSGMPKIIYPYMKYNDEDLDCIFAKIESDNQLKLMDFDNIPWKEEYLKRMAEKRKDFEYNPETLEPYLIRAD